MQKIFLALVVCAAAWSLPAPQVWDKFFAICECVPLNTLAKAADMFAGFTPVED